MAALICLLLEHQSQEDQAAPLRLLLFATQYWERQWRAWKEGHKRGDKLRLSPVLPIVFHTGGEPWDTARTLADLIEAPPGFAALVPSWRPLFWDLAMRPPQTLLDAPGEWLKALAVVRATREDGEAFAAVFAEAVKRLEPLAASDKMRWQDLLWFALSWVVQRRGREERAPLLARTEASVNQVALREEIAAMSGAVIESWADEMKRLFLAEGRAEGEARGRLSAAREKLRVLLEEKFGALPAEIVQRVEALDDLARLDESFRRAIRVSRLEDWSPE